MTNNPDELTQVIILGASGDLTARKLVPALYTAQCQHLLPGRIQLIGVARRPWSNADFHKQLTDSSPAGCSYDSWEAFLGITSYIQCRLEEATDFPLLKAQLDKLANGATNRVFYLAIKPELFLATVRNLHAAGLLDQSGGNSRRVVVEKPFGHDLQSAQVLNADLLKILTEDQLYRIDHYLGKETVQNLLVFRFRNAFFEPLWNQKYIEMVQITVAETVGMENGRGGYYDTSGAIRDILQNHLLQLVALVAMESPGSITPKAIRDEKVKVLQSLRPFTSMAYNASHIVRAQFEGYRKEPGVRPDSDTETYIACRTYIDNWRWGGVPFVLRTGKHLPKRFTSITVQFRMPPTTLFGSYDECHLRPNRLTIRVQPNEGIDLDFDMKEPGQGMVIKPAQLTFDYQKAFSAPTPEAYQRLLQDVVIGDQSLFIRSDEVEESWRWADSLRTAMQAAPVNEYPRNSWGPKEANGLFGECEGRWVTG